MKAKFSLHLSEANWEKYPEQSELAGDGAQAEFIVELPEGPWVEFTYGGLRGTNSPGGDIFLGLSFGTDELVHYDGRVFSDLVIEFIPDEEG